MSFKKITAILLVLVMLLSVLTGCKKPSQENSEKNENEDINTSTGVVDEIPEEIMPVIDEKDAKAFDEFLEDFKSFTNLADFENADIEKEYAISRVVVKGDPDLTGFDVVASVKDSYGYTYVQLSSPEEAEKFDLAQQEKGLESFEDFLISSLEADPDVEFVESDDVYMQSYGMSLASSPYSSNVSSNKTFTSWGTSYIGSATYSNILHLKKMQNTKIIVAVLDDGADLNHPFYKDRLIQGYDFVDNDSNTTGIKRFGHGTHVIGTIVDNTPGLNVKIMPVRTIGHIAINKETGKEEEVGTLSELINSIKYAEKHGASVMNMSLGINAKENNMSQSAINYIKDTITAAVKKGITVCVAAGNDALDTKYYTPGGIESPGVIVVSAINRSENLAYFSNYGSNVDLCAPGQDIVSCAFDNSYVSMDGTSMATPHVTAAVAMVKLSHPDYSPAQIEAFLKKHAKDLGSYGVDEKFGAGALQLFECDRAETIKELYIITDPSKTEYLVGDEFDLAGATLHIRYADDAVRQLVIPRGYKIDASWAKLLKECQISVSPVVFNEAGVVRTKISSIYGSREVEVLVKGDMPGILPTMNTMFPATDGRLLFHPDTAEASEDIRYVNRYEDLGIRYDEATNTLYLNNLKSGFIVAQSMGNGFTVNVSGINTIYLLSAESFGHSSSIKITGDGALNVVSDAYYGENVYGNICIHAEMTESRLIIDSDVTVRAKHGVEIRATICDDPIVVKSPCLMAHGIYLVDDDPNGDSSYNKWIIERQIKNLNGNVLPMYFAYTYSTYGDTLFTPLLID